VLGVFDQEICVLYCVVLVLLRMKQVIEGDERYVFPPPSFCLGDLCISALHPGFSLVLDSPINPEE
jgi:hypothetical protein